MNSLSGIKDVDREILLAMTDKDLLKTCSLNKYLLHTVCDDDFFYRILKLRYPDTLNYNEKEETYNISGVTETHLNLSKRSKYKSYYLTVIYYISKLKENYNYSYVRGNPKVQYHIFKNAGKSSTALLLQSSIKGELNLVKESVKRGANIHTEDENALRWASLNGHLDVVKYLVENGANIHANNDEALHWASEDGHLDVVKYLVENGANIHANDDEALQLASENGHLEVVKYLVENGANIHANDDKALQLASENGHLEVVKYLSDQLADHL